MGLSKNLIAILNALTALLSIAIIGSGAWLATRSNNASSISISISISDCIRFLQWPLILLGSLLLAVSLLGLVGAMARSTCLLCVYSAFMLLLLLLVFCFTVFAFVVTYNGAGGSIASKGLKEVHLGSYSSWLQTQVNRDSVWAKIRACVADSHACRDVAVSGFTLGEADGISSIQSGCCKAPAGCGVRLGSNATDWTENKVSGPAPTTTTTTTTTRPLSDTSDCALWSNDPSELCYSCASCKAGVLERVRKDWRTLSIVNVVLLAFLVAVYSVSCCAIRSVRRDKRYGYV